MSNNYETIYPTSQRDQYNPNENIQFNVTYQNKKVLRNSYFITGDLYVRNGGGATVLANTDDVRLDPYAGVHCLFDQFTTSMNGSVIENLQEYPRYVRAISEALVDQDTIATSSSTQVELRAGRDSVYQNRFILGQDDSGFMPFGFRPLIAANQSVRDMSYKKTGGVQISTRLRTYDKAFYGASNVAGITYYLKNVQLHYLTIPDMGDDDNQPLQFLVNHMLKSNISTSTQNIMNRVPLTLNSFSSTFIRQADETDSTLNNNQTSVLPGLNRLEYSFNDSNAQFITYPIENQEDIIENYLNSWGNSSETSYRPGLHYINDGTTSGYGVGLNLGQYVNFSNQNLGINIQSSVTNNDPYSMYSYYHGVVVL